MLSRFLSYFQMWTELRFRHSAPGFETPLKDLVDEAWGGLLSGSEKIPMGMAKWRSQVVEAERRKAFADECLRSPATSLKNRRGWCQNSSSREYEKMT